MSSTQVSAEQLVQIGDEHKKQMVDRPVTQEGAKKEYRLICRACSKPNSLSVTHCSACGFECLNPRDLGVVPENAFSNLLLGIDPNQEILFSGDKDFLVIRDIYPQSAVHFMVIPRDGAAKDISELTHKDIGKIERMKKLAIDELCRRNLDREIYGDPSQYEHIIALAFGYPPSVKHLHMSAILPPFYYPNVLQYPRHHPYAKVLSDLTHYGRAITHMEKPDEQLGKQEYERMMQVHHRIKSLMDSKKIL